MQLAYDVSRCKAETADGTSCKMKNNCLRYLTKFFDDKDPNLKIRTYSIITAPDSIINDPLNCSLKIPGQYITEIRCKGQSEDEVCPVRNKCLRYEGLKLDILNRNSNVKITNFFIGSDEKCDKFIEI